MRLFPGTGPDDETASPAGRDRRTLLVAGGLVAALAVGGGAYLVLGGGSGVDTATSSVTPATTSRSATPVPTPSAVVATIPAAATLPQGRNPFKVLYTAPPTAAPTASGVPTTPVTSPTSPTVPTSGTSGSPVPTTTYALTLNAFGQLLGDARSMSWTVDGVKKSVLVGQRFGKSGELVVLTVKTVNGASQAVLQIGDAAPRSIGVGATIEVL